jgi:hypothetical protein
MRFCDLWAVDIFMVILLVQRLGCYFNICISPKDREDLFWTIRTRLDQIGLEISLIFLNIFKLLVYVYATDIILTILRNIFILVIKNTMPPRELIL